MKQSQEPKKLRLVKLTPAYRRQLLEMLEPWLAREQDFSPYAIRKNDPHDFEAYLAGLEVKEATPEGLVPESVFFCLDEERDIFVGAVSIRHSLGPRNCVTGGHIGDGIRPEERRKGYATAMIALALEECRKLGIRKVLMTCDASNIGSARSIEKNGGVLDPRWRRTACWKTGTGSPWRRRKSSPPEPCCAGKCRGTSGMPLPGAGIPGCTGSCWPPPAGCRRICCPGSGGRTPIPGMTM